MTLHFDDKKLESNALVGAGIRRKGGFYAARAKRILDIFLVLLTAPISVPLILFFALFVALDGAPPFYRQERIGRNGRTFKLLKLRTMVPDAEARLEACLCASSEARQEWDATQKLKRDPRTTGIGRVLRKLSLDELPQLWNILKGDMAIVGPRPMLESQKDMYPGEAYFRLRPGLTGYWQISDRNDSEFVQRARFDSKYYEDMSLAVDLSVILRTVSVVLRGTGY